MQCLVTGASGAIGPTLVGRLLADGNAVRVFSRHPDRAAWDGRVDVRRGDIADASSVKSALDGIETVFHLAALLHVVNPPSSMRSDYERINVEGTRAVVDGAVTSGVRRVVFFSTIAVYGPTDRVFVTEDRAPHPDTLYGETKLAAERLVLAARSAGTEPLGTVLRPAAVYGPGLKGNYRRLVTAIHRRRFVPVGSGHNRRTLVFDEDLAAAAIAAAVSPRAQGETYNVTDGAVHTMQQIVAAISAALGRKPPRFFIPETPVRVAARAVESAANLIGFPAPITTATVDKYLEDVAVSGTRISTELGWKPGVDLGTGWKRTVEALRRTGTLQ